MNQSNTGGLAAASQADIASRQAMLPTIPMLQTRYGVMLAPTSESALARSLTTYGEWVEQELDVLGALLEEGQTVLEYGAELGAHTLWLSQMVGHKGQVHVVEPRRFGHIALCSALALNHLGNVYPLHASLGDARRDVTLGATDTQPEEGSQQTAVDALKLSPLHLIKVNQSGGLLPLLSGAEKTIRDQQPLIYFRLSTADMATKEIAALKALGYRCWSHLPYLYSTDNFNSSATNIFPGWVSQNVIAAHQDKSVDLAHLTEL